MTTEERLTRLELRVGRWRVLALAACGVVGMVVFGGAGRDDSSQTITVQRIKFVDEQGRDCGGLECKDGETGLSLRTANNKSSVAMGTAKGTAGVFITSKEGKPVVSLSAETLGGTLTLKHPTGEAAFEVVPVDGIAVSLKTADAKGNEIWAAPLKNSQQR